MTFEKAIEKGQKSELIAEQFFKKQNYTYIDVRDNPQYQKQDIDYIVNELGSVEVKTNYHIALYGRPGYFFWIEISVGNNEGFWYKSKADWFMFLNDKGSGILIENNELFKLYINNLIDNGDHSAYGNNRFDTIKDKRYNRYIEVVNMRVYLESIDKKLNIIKIVKRKYES